MRGAVVAANKFVADPPAFPDDGVLKVQPFGRQVLPEHSVRQFPPEPPPPAVEVLAGNRHRLPGPDRHGA